MSLLAVEEEFAATQNFNPGQRRRLNFIARTYLRARMGRSAIRRCPYSNMTRLSTLPDTIGFFRKATASSPTSWFRALEPSLGTK